MEEMTVLAAAVTAAAAFAATNVDDLFVLMLLFGQARGADERRKIVLGQFLGVALLTAVSLAGGLGLGLLAPRYLRLLGLAPIALGLRAWRNRNDREEAPGNTLSAPAVAALTVVNGGDNIGVYLPLFAQMRGGERAVTLLVFALLCGLWCAVSRRLAALPAVAQTISRHKSWLVPLVLVLLGLCILMG